MDECSENDLGKEVNEGKAVIVKNILFRGEIVEIQDGISPTRLYIKGASVMNNHKAAEYLFSCRKVLCRYASLCINYSVKHRWSGYECNACPKLESKEEVVRADETLVMDSDDAHSLYEGEDDVE